MNQSVHFYVENGGEKVPAEVLSCFFVFEECYCIYTIPSSQAGNRSVYCAKIVGNTLVRIETEEERRLTNRVVMKLINALQRVEY